MTFLRRGFVERSLRTSILLSHPATPRDAVFDHAHGMRWRSSRPELELDGRPFHSLLGFVVSRDQHLPARLESSRRVPVILERRGVLMSMRADPGRDWEISPSEGMVHAEKPSGSPPCWRDPCRHALPRTAPSPRRGRPLLGNSPPSPLVDFFRILQPPLNLPLAPTGERDPGKLSALQMVFFFFSSLRFLQGEG